MCNRRQLSKMWMFCGSKILVMELIKSWGSSKVVYLDTQWRFLCCPFIPRVVLCMLPAKTYFYNVVWQYQKCCLKVVSTEVISTIPVLLF